MRGMKDRLTGGIIHCFSGSAETAKEYLRLGYYISFAGPLTFKKAPKLQEAARIIPKDRLLIETDSPYMAPEPVRGRRNEPANVRYVGMKLAELRGETPEGAEQLASINEDYRAWLTIDGTSIDYPVVQGKDNQHYAAHDFYGNDSTTGIVFLAAENRGNLFDSYNVLYGQYTDSGAMFGLLDRFRENAGRELATDRMLLG